LSRFRIGQVEKLIVDRVILYLVEGIYLLVKQLKSIAYHRVPAIFLEVKRAFVDYRYYVNGI